jgi:ParB/RepB/Spo0J family partition protein
MSTDRFLRQNPNPVPLDTLSTPDFDVREYRTDADIENIRESMDNKGQIMPILLGSPDGGQYPILDGNHRYLAAKRAGWPDIDAIQTGASIQDDEAQIISNISRLELSQQEKLSTFDYMLTVLDYSQTEAADAVGFDRSQVTRYAGILNGYGEVKEYFIQGELGVEACYELNKVEDRDRAVNIAETAVKEGYRDADVVHQARHARKPDEYDDTMRGAGTQAVTESMQQVKKNAEAIQSLDPMDPQAVAQAQAGPDAAAGTPQEGESTQQPSEPQGEPCMGCGEPMPSGALAVVQLRPELAQQLGIQQLEFGGSCTGALVEWWQERQQQTEPETDTVEAPQ